MTPILKARLRTIATAMLAFVAVLFAAATPSFASGYTFSFDGTVNDATIWFDTLGITPGDAVSGSITYNPFNADTSSPIPTGNQFDQSAVSFTFHVEHAGGLSFTYSDTGSGQVAYGNSTGNAPGFGFTNFGAESYLQLALVTDASGPSSLTSLAGLPTTPAGLAALLGGTSTLNFGVFQIANGFGYVQFSLNLNPAIATTPIPAALPLFGTGLALLGFIASKRRSTRTPAAG